MDRLALFAELQVALTELQSAEAAKKQAAALALQSAIAQDQGLWAARQSMLAAGDIEGVMELNRHSSPPSSPLMEAASRRLNDANARVNALRAQLQQEPPMTSPTNPFGPAVG
jgi:hypothetical protein